jgi:hypothetical protein
VGALLKRIAATFWTVAAFFTGGKMSQKWEPGARAVIVVSNHYVNVNRVVVLVDPLEIGDWREKGWSVRDGKLFRGFGLRDMHNLWTSGNRIIDADLLGIEQWKMRLLDDNDITEEDAEGVVYVVDIAAH